MNVNDFKKFVIGKNITIYVCDSEEKQIYCKFKMNNIIDYGNNDSNIDIYDNAGNMISFSSNGILTDDEDNSFKYQTEDKTYLISCEGY